MRSQESGLGLFKCCHKLLQAESLMNHRNAWLTLPEAGAGGHGGFFSHPALAGWKGQEAPQGLLVLGIINCSSWYFPQSSVDCCIIFVSEINRH